MSPVPSLQAAIPWTVIASSADMMDLTLGNRVFPYACRSWLPISVHQPDLPPEAPGSDENSAADPNARDSLFGPRMAFVTITCSTTSYQPASGEEAGTLILGDERLEELEGLAGE